MGDGRHIIEGIILPATALRGKWRQVQGVTLPRLVHRIAIVEQSLSLLEHLLHPRLASRLLTRFFVPAPPVLVMALIVRVPLR
jgi:hypothetical protein